MIRLNNQHFHLLKHLSFLYVKKVTFYIIKLVSKVVNDSDLGALANSVAQNSAGQCDLKV